MAHTFIMTRGIKHEVDQFITELQGKYLPFKWRDVNIKDSKLQDTMVQLGVRPIQLWELVYPEEQRDVILTTLFDNPPNPEVGRGGGQTQHKRHGKFIWLLRKMIGIKDPPKTWNTNQRMPIRRLGMELIHVGDKGDKWVNKDGVQVDEKEDGAFEAL